MTYEDEVQSLLTDNSLLHLIAGLAAESGEVCGIIQKAAYKMTEISKDEMCNELGDTLFYVTALAKHFGFSLETLQQTNLTKLRKRHGK